MASPLILSLKKQRSFYGSTISILSPAKINLYLNIIGKYPQGSSRGNKSSSLSQAGFHQIESIVERISLFDQITIKLKKGSDIRIFSNYKSLQTNRNLICKCIRLLKKHFPIPFGFDIALKKNIPLGSGLGGGSSNAASTLLGLDTLLGLKITQDKLYQLGAMLGSDVNFFLSQSRFAFLEGKGEKVTSLDINNKFSHFVIWPNLEISTKKVYAQTRVKLTIFFNNVKILLYALEHNDVFLMRKSIFNALEREAFSIYPELKKVKMLLDKQGIFSKLSGSGSAFYTIGTCLATTKGKKRDYSNISITKIRSIIPSSWRIFKVETF